VEYEIDTLYPVDGKTVPTTGEESGDSYWAWTVGDSLYFSKLVPSGYTPGGSIKIKIEESSPNASDNHKWQFAVKLLPTVPVDSEYDETFSQEYTSSATANQHTDRTIAIHTNGTIEGKYARPGDEVIVTIERIAASTDEDSERIKMFTLIIEFGGLEGSSAQLPGRLGSIISEVYERLNDVKLRSVPSYFLVRQCNRVMDDLADAGLFKKTGTLTLVSGTESYSLITNFADYVKLNGIKWTTTRIPIIGAKNKQTYDRILQAIPSGEPIRYWIDNLTLLLAPVYGGSPDDTLDIYYSYRPPDLDTLDNYNPPVPATYDELFVAWCLFAAVQTFEIDTGRPGQSKSGDFLQFWKNVRRKLLGNNEPKRRHLGYYR